jgi:predicted dehydrogenase
MKRFAVIGCGWITAALHGPVYGAYVREHPDLVPAACCDVDLGRAEEIRRRFGFQRAWSDPRAMLAEEDLDAVCLNVPPGLASALGCVVLRRGVALLSEKPPGLTPDELENMIAAAREGGAGHMVAFNRRWAPLTRRLRSRLEGLAVEHLLCTQSRVNRRDADFGTTLVHAVDTVGFLAGSEYRRVQIEWRELADVAPGAANYVLRAEMANGALAEIAVTPMAGIAVERTLVSARHFSAELRHPTGADGTGGLDIYTQGRCESSLNGVEAAGGNEAWCLEGFYQEDAAFFDALLEGRKPPDGLETARQAVAIMAAARERRREVVFA